MKNSYASALILCSILLCNCKKSLTADLIIIDPVPVVLPEITKTFDIAYGTLHTSQKVDVYTP